MDNLTCKIEQYPIEIKRKEIVRWPLRGFIPCKPLEILEKIRGIVKAGS